MSAARALAGLCSELLGREDGAEQSRLAASAGTQKREDSVAGDGQIEGADDFRRRREVDIGAEPPSRTGMLVAAQLHGLGLAALQHDLQLAVIEQPLAAQQFGNERNGQRLFWLAAGGNRGGHGKTSQGGWRARPATGAEIALDGGMTGHSCNRFHARGLTQPWQVVNSPAAPAALATGFVNETTCG